MILPPLVFTNWSVSFGICVGWAVAFVVGSELVPFIVELFVSFSEMTSLLLVPLVEPFMSSFEMTLFFFVEFFLILLLFFFGFSVEICSVLTRFSGSATIFVSAYYLQHY